MRRAIIALCVLAAPLSAGVGRASESAPQDAARARRVALARAGVAASGQAEGLKILLSQEVDAHIELIRAANGALTPQYLAELREAMLGMVVSGLEAQGGLLDEIAVMQADYYTEEELQGMIDFYDSELGRKMKKLTPELAGKGADIGRKWAERETPRFEAQFKARLKAKGLAVPGEKKGE